MVRRGAKNVMMSGPLAPYQHHVSGRSTVRRFQVGTWKTYGARSNEVVAATLIRTTDPDGLFTLLMVAGVPVYRRTQETGRHG